MFQPLNHLEISDLITSYQVLIGARLQLAAIQGEVVIFHFFKQGQDFLLSVDLSKNQPFLWLDQRSLRKAPATKPILLYLRSHFYGKILTELKMIENKGRAFVLCFAEAQIEVRLIPRATNIIAAIGKTSIAIEKPHPLENIQNNQIFEKRDYASLFSQYFKERSLVKVKTDKKKNPIEKIERALVKIDEELKVKEKTNEIEWQDLGTQIKTYGIKSLAEDQNKLLKFPESLKEALNSVYELEKKSIQKLTGMQKRKIELLEELERLKSQDSHSDDSQKLSQKVSPKIKDNLLKIAAAQGRTLHEEGFDFFVGKSARDNLALLRKAQSWDLWLHLRDYPSAHGILRRAKGKEVPRAVIERCAQFLIKNTFKQERSKSMNGEKFDVMFTECRYVRPIKGDQVGRVNYREETSFLLTFDLARA